MLEDVIPRRKRRPEKRNARRIKKSGKSYRTSSDSEFSPKATPTQLRPALKAYPALNKRLVTPIASSKSVRFPQPHSFSQMRRALVNRPTS